MAVVLVTGGTGRLGTHVVAELAARGYQPRVLSRHAGPDRVVGDLATGAGLDAAVDGVDAIVHAATGARTGAVDVRGTGRLLAAALRAGVGHVVYVSIVGVDRNPFRYYRAKLEAERLVAAGGGPYTVARGTQFYDLVAGVLDKLRVGPLLFAPRDWQVEPHAPSDFARALVERVVAGPTGGITEFGGPQRFTAAELAASWHHHRGRSGRIRQFPVPGRSSAAWRAGAQVSGPDAERGGTTWEQWLAAR